MTVGKRIGLGFGAILLVLAALGVAALFGVTGIVGNASEVIGGNKLRGNLAQREVDHLNWANKVSALLTDDKITKLDVQLDPHKCAFGQWYYGEGRREAEAMLPALKTFLQEIEAPHQHLHESAAHIDQTFQQPHPGLALTLSNMITAQVKWVATVNQNLAREAAGLYSYQSQVRGIIDEAFSVVRGLDEASGLGDPAARQRLAKAAIAPIRFGPDQSDYVFIMDTAHALLVHPKAELVGKNMKESKDPNGKALFQEMVSVALAKGEGFVSYYWPKVGSDRPVPKITYVKLYKPWGWIIGTGIFLDEKNQALLKRAEEFAAGKPFSLGVQVDPTQCSLARFLSSPEAEELRGTFPAFKAAMDALDEPHRALHASAVHIEQAVNKLDMASALSIYEKETLPALESVNKNIATAIDAESALTKGFNEASHIYATETRPNLMAVQSLLSKMAETVKDNIMTDEVMLASARGTERNVVVLGLIAIVLGIILAFFISRGLIRVLARVADGIGGNAEQVVEASGQVSSASQQLAEGASEQAASLEETSASLEEMSSMTRQNADNAAQANSLMDETRRVVGRAEGSMKEMTRSMTEISASGSEIGKIIKTIDEIAFQTNLLALNAAVEAARAGEAGAGFAVVADEVRNLAQRAAEAAKNTASLIEETINKIDQGGHLVKEAGNAFSEVATNSDKVAELISEIAAASNEQAQGIDQINQAISQLDQVTQQNASTSEESASASAEMNSQAENMVDLVGDLLNLVGRTRAVQTRTLKPARRIQAPAGRSAPPAKIKAGGKRREVKADDVIPMDEDFSDF